MKIPDFLDVFYTTNKNELKLMWVSRNTEVLDCSFPQKWEVYACSMLLVTQYLDSLTFSLVTLVSMNDIPIIQGKRIMNCTYPHTSIT